MAEKKTLTIAVTCIIIILFLVVLANSDQKIRKLEKNLGELEEKLRELENRHISLYPDHIKLTSDLHARVSSNTGEI